MNSVKKFIAEFIGTMVLVVLGCGTAMLVGCDAANGGGYILTALAFGLVIVGMAYCVAWLTSSATSSPSASALSRARAFSPRFSVSAA